MSKALQLITSRDQEFLIFLKAKFQLFHASNVFLRDLHYGVMEFIASHRQRMSYTASEALTREVIAHFERSGILKPIDERTWMVDHEEFRPVSTKTAPPAKPVTPLAAQQPAA